MSSPLPSRERHSIQNGTPSPGGRELEGGGNFTLTLILSPQGRGETYRIVLPPLAGAGKTVYTSPPSPGGRELEGGGRKYTLTSFLSPQGRGEEE